MGRPIDQSRVWAARPVNTVTLLLSSVSQKIAHRSMSARRRSKGHGDRRAGFDRRQRGSDLVRRVHRQTHPRLTAIAERAAQSVESQRRVHFLHQAPPCRAADGKTLSE